MSPTKGDAAVNFLTDQPGADQDPRWTPNGDAIIWTSHRDAGDAEIYWMRADGTHPQRLTDRAGEDGVADVRAL